MHSNSPPCARERGAALLLAFLVTMILVVVVVQLAVSSIVDRSIAINSLREAEFEMSARAGCEMAKALLVKDLKDEEAQSPEGEGGGEAGGAGDTTSMTGMGGVDPSAAGGETANSAQNPTDSISDEWADPTASQEQFGDGIEVRLRIQDEDRKFNLLSLIADDQEFREESREILIRLLDAFREDTKNDLSKGEAGDVADGIAEWFRGQRDNEFPLPRQASDKKDDSGRIWSEDIFKDDGSTAKTVYPLSLDELLEVKGMSENLLHGYMDLDRYVPGLEDVATVWTNLAFDEEAVDTGEEEEGFKNPFDQDADGAGAGGSAAGGKASGGNDKGGGGDAKAGGETPQGAGGGEGEEAGAEGEDPLPAETDQGRININTAPLPVLRALVSSDDLPFSVLEKIDEFRRKALDEDEKLGLSTSALTGGGQQNKKKGGGSSDQEGEGEEESPEDADGEDEDFTYHTAEEVIQRTEDYFNQKFELDDKVVTAFSNRIGVKSNVFTIMLELRSNKNVVRTDSREVPPPERLYRAIVWRRKGSDGKFQCVNLVPLHPWTGVLPPVTEETYEERPFGF